MRNIAKKRDVPDQDMARGRGQSQARPGAAGKPAHIVYLAPAGVGADARAKPPPGLY